MPNKVKRAGKRLASRSLAKVDAGGAFSKSIRGKVLTKDDGIYSFVGIGAGKIPGGMSTKKHVYCK